MGPMQQGVRITTGAEMTAMEAEKDLGHWSLLCWLLPKNLPVERSS